MKCKTLVFAPFDYIRCFCRWFLLFLFDIFFLLTIGASVNVQDKVRVFCDVLERIIIGKRSRVWKSFHQAENKTSKLNWKSQRMTFMCTCGRVERNKRQHSFEWVESQRWDGDECFAKICNLLFYCHEYCTHILDLNFCLSFWQRGKLHEKKWFANCLLLRYV